MSSSNSCRVAVVGGGINGVMSAWSLAKAGRQVDLFEAGGLMGATSSASTKLIHGGLRYLEQGALGLVRESLLERRWWLEQAPDLVRTIELVLPIYKGRSRSRAVLATGLWLYDRLAGSRGIGRFRWLNRKDLRDHAPELSESGLLGGFLFHDAQMDDRALGLWAALRAQEAGVRVHEGLPVERISADGTLFAGEERNYGWIVNAAGPWCRELLDRSGLPARHRLDLVRGSHLVLERPMRSGLFLQVPGESRIAFALPWKGGTLLGTTEERQGLDDPIACSAAEEAYLLDLYNAYFDRPAGPGDVRERFAGLRPLVADGSGDPGRTTREYVIERQGRVLTVFGGKWTTARVLGEKVAAGIAAAERER